MDYKIVNTYKITEIYELSVDWNGFNFLVIYGHHKNGWFVAVPNWNICTEIGHPKDDAYNTTKIARTHIHDAAPVYLARAIRQHWEDMKRKEE